MCCSLCVVLEVISDYQILLDQLLAIEVRAENVSVAAGKVS